jgi:UDP-3-O-[3-hydroxymyristoyl] glucosamine N-acyltransferase
LAVCELFINFAAKISKLMEFSANQIAELVGGTVEGDGNAPVSTFAKIETAGRGALTFLSNPKYAHHLYAMEDGVALVKDDLQLEHPVHCTLIRVANPYATLAQLMRMVDEIANPRRSGVEQPSYVDASVSVPEDAYIGAFAYVGAGAKLGAGVQIYPQAYVGPGVEIGSGSVVYPGVKIYHGCKIGARCILHAGAVIGADGFGFAPMPDGTYSKIPQMGCVEIADDVEIGANTTVDRATMGATRVGRGTKLDNLIQIAHNVEVGHDTVMAAQAGVAGSAKVGSNCQVGGQVGIAGHIRVGDRVGLGAQCGIHSNTPDGAIQLGTPAMDARKFMRVSACLTRLPEMNLKLSRLEKQLNELTQKPQ